MSPDLENRVNILEKDIRASLRTASLGYTANRALRLLDLAVEQVKRRLENMNINEALRDGE